MTTLPPEDSLGTPPPPSPLRARRQAAYESAAPMLTPSLRAALRELYVAGRYGRGQRHPQRMAVYLCKAQKLLAENGVELPDIPPRTHGINGTEVWIDDDQLVSRCCDTCGRRYAASLSPNGYKAEPTECDRGTRSREQAKVHGSRYYPQDWSDPEY